MSATGSRPARDTARTSGAATEPQQTDGFVTAHRRAQGTATRASVERVSNLRDFERRWGVWSKACSPRRSARPAARRARETRDQGDGGGTHRRGLRVWAPNRFEFSLAMDAPSTSSRSRPRSAPSCRGRAGERRRARLGIGRPARRQVLMDEALKKGDFRCTASLVEGEQQAVAAARPFVRSPPSLRIHESGADARSRSPMTS